MKTIKQYIKNHKQLIIIYLGAITFLFVHNYAYCHPIILTFITPAISYFSAISPEFYAGKIIDKVFEYSPWIMNKSFEYSPYVIYGTGIIGVAAISLPVSIKAMEIGYNWRYFANIYAQKTPVIGSLLKGANTTYKWFTNQELTLVEYTPFFPKVASVLGFPDLFNKKLEFDFNTFKSRLLNRDYVEYRDRTVFVDTPINVVEYKEKPIYIPITEYKDRENLIDLGTKADNLSRIGNDLIFIASNQKSRDLLIEEINSLREHENAVCLYMKDLNKNYVSFSIPGVTDADTYSPIPMKLKTIIIPPRENTPVAIVFENHRISVNLTHEVFKQKYPSIYMAISIFARREDGTQKAAVIDLAYTNSRGLFTTNFVFDPLNCILREAAGYDDISQVQSCNLLSKMEESQILISQVTNNDFNLAIQELKEKISNENRLINVNIRDQGTQTAYFDLNETIYDRINSFLEVRDETSLIVASRDGRNLPFNNIQISSYSKPQEIAKTQTQETSIETQTGPVLNDNVTTASLGALNSNLFQNMGVFFTTVLAGAIAHDFQTLDLLARSLLGFVHIPEYNQAFLAATQMSIADLQVQYGFTLEEARKAFDALDYAKEVRNTGSLPESFSSTLSDSNFDITSKPIDWGKYLLTGTIIIATGCTVYFMYQSLKNGSYTNGNELQTISPNIEVWKKALFDKINKL